MKKLGELTLEELVELRDRLARELTERFEQRLAPMLADAIRSTAGISSSA